MIYTFQSLPELLAPFRKIGLNYYFKLTVHTLGNLCILFFFTWTIGEMNYLSSYKNHSHSIFLLHCKMR